MSDSEGDFSDELLELAGAVEKKRKSRPSSSKSSSKRQKSNAKPVSDSEDEYESEEDDANPYPLEGKFIDEADRHKLMDLPEVEREEILSQRMEEMQRLQDKRNLDQMHRAQRGESDNVSKAAKRVHAVRGATKEKSRKLDELKAKRRAKGDKKRSRPDSPKRDRSSSPMDMEMSDDEDEDGQISKLEQEEEREHRLLSKLQPEEDGPVTSEDLDSCRLTRDLLCKYSHRVWFGDFVRGAWVRYLVGSDEKGPLYRICEITGLGPNVTKPYKVDNEYFDQQLELKHGAAIRHFTLERVSNSGWSQREFDRLKITLDVDKQKLPFKKTIEKKVTSMQKLVDQQMTESDVSAMLAKKQILQPAKLSSAMSTLERSKILQELNLARKRHDTSEVAKLEEKLRAFNEAMEPYAVKEVDPLALVNERNRLANLEAIRRAESQSAKKRMRDRKAALANSRSGTPGLLKSSNATPKDSPLLLPTLGIDSHNAATRSVSPLPASAMGNGTSKPLQKRTFEAMMVSEIEVDLGDF